jgi:hypothetical protein
MKEGNFGSENFITTDPNNLNVINPENPLNNVDKQSTGRKSTEKIVKLARGCHCWIKICVVFAISVVLFGVSLGVALSNRNMVFMFAFTGIGAIGIFVCFCILTCCNGFIIVNPNEAIVYQYYGRYIGTLKENGYFYGFPCSRSTRVSLRTNQYNGNKVRVNDREGNPVELGIIVIWRIGDTAKALYDVVGYEQFVRTQSDASLRYIGCKYPYEPIVPGEISLKSGHEIINKELKGELRKRVDVSGIIIEDARITEIAYGAEVANMMLQKQTSNATAYAKDAIVRGATTAVMNSLNEFAKNGYEFSDEAKNKYVTDMMTTLCMGSDINKIVGN